MNKRTIALLLLALASARCDNARAEGRGYRPYCGIYCLYAYASAEGLNVDFDSLLKPEFVSSVQGSSADELKRAAQFIGVEGSVAHGLTVVDLYLATTPIILHYRSHRGSRVYDHWVLYCGDEGGKALLVDPSRGQMTVPYAELLSRWDGGAVILGRNAQETATPLWTGRVILLLLLFALAAGTKLILQPSWKSSANTRGLDRTGIAFRIKAFAGFAALCVALGTAIHCLPSFGFLYNPASVASVAAPFCSRELPTITTQELQSMIGNAENTVVLIDARFEEDYLAGHIAHAVNYPIDVQWSEEAELLRAIPVDSRIVVYCQSKRCGFDEEVAARLVASGHTGITLYPEGFVGWTTEGNAIHWEE